MSTLIQLDSKSFQQVSELIHQLMGITIKPGRQAMIEGRLRKRLEELGLTNYQDYVALVKKDSEVRQAFINAIATNETYFYRTPRIWEYLSETYLDQIYQNSAGGTLKCWSAASSTGEEAHTLGILLENYKRSHPGFNYKVDATDISSKVLATASTGIFNGRSIERFRQARPELFSKYMVGNEEEGYSVETSIKNNINFFQYNLFERPRTNNYYDLVLIRNVLIYFKQADQKIVMNNVRTQLKENGVVIIGESESLNNLKMDLEGIAPTIYRKSQTIEMRKSA